MNRKTSVIWMSAAGITGILFGIFYAFYGLSGFPPYRLLIPADKIGLWSNGLYGSTFIGFSVLLFFAGRHAFQQQDRKLMKILLYGIYAWLTVEAAFSLWYAVYFNVLVDLLLAAVLGYPLVKGLRTKKKNTAHGK